MLLPLLRYLLIFRRRNSVWDYLRLLHITDYLQLEATDSTKKTEIPGTVLHKLSQEGVFYRTFDDVWTYEGKRKHLCLQEKSKKSNDRLSWTNSVLKSTYCIFRGQNWPFSNFRSLPWTNDFFKLYIFFHETPEAKKQSYVSIGFRMRGHENCSRPTQAPGWPLLAICVNFLQCSPQKSVYRTAKNEGGNF